MSKSQLKRFIAQGAVVVAKCVACGARKEIKPGDMPMCVCGSIMIAESAMGKA